MDQELMDMGYLINNVDAVYKVQYIRLINFSVNLNRNPAEPFFIKANLDYDKYELPTVLPFEQFDMLFRPFKNNTIFKIWFYCNLISAVTFVLLVIFLFIQQSISWLWKLQLYLICFMMGLEESMFTELQNYCQIIRHQAVRVKLVNRNNCFYRKDFLHFEVRSKVVEEDGKKIKLYLKNGGDEIVGVVEKEAIFQKKDFLFNENLLDKLMTFEEFQQQIRAFKDNQAHKACVFWKRSEAVLLCLMVFILLMIIVSPIFIPIIFLLIVLYCIVRSKKSASKSKMVHQLRAFCQNVSLKNEQVQVIAHLRKDPMQRWCLPDQEQLFCFEIRRKEHIHS